MVSAPLVNFRLYPLERIEPWQGQWGPTLNWFALTLGEYWLQAGDTRLLYYTDAAGGCPCEYQVARLFQDVRDLLPYAMDPVPENLQSYILDGWIDHMEKWAKAADKLRRARKARGAAGISTACSWIGLRCLDTGYLTPSANIVFWSDRDSVHIGWDNRGKEADGIPAWEASVGRWQMTRAAFLAELGSFEDRLNRQMEERVAQVLGGALDPRIRINHDALQQEQDMRRRGLIDLTDQWGKRDWAPVVRAVQRFEMASG